MSSFRKGYLLRAGILYGVCVFCSLSAPSLFFVEEYARTHDGCVMLAGAFVMVVVTPLALVGWAAHVGLNAVLSYRRHRDAPRAVWIDALRGGLTGAIWVLCAISALVALGWMQAPGGTDDVEAFDGVALALAALLGALVGWRLGVYARKASDAEEG